MSKLGFADVWSSLRSAAVISLTIFVVAGAAQAASVSYSVGTASTPGEPGVFSLGTANLDTATTGPFTISGITPLSFGSFVTNASNSNVVANGWSLNVNATVTSGTSVMESFSFAGSISNPSANVYDLNFSSPANTTYTYVNYPTTSSTITFATENVTFGSLGTYTIGIETDYPINSPTKSTPVYAFIEPATSPTAPEPLSAGLTGLAMAGLLGFAARRKFRTARS